MFQITYKLINKSTKKNIFICEVRTIYIFNGKTVLKCNNKIIEIFINKLVMINNVN